MKITAITTQQRDPNRVNVMVDGKYRFSLDIFQLSDIGVKVGRDYSDQELAELEREGQFGKLYTRALEYCLSRPHSAMEIRNYLSRKTVTRRTRNKKSGEIKIIEGVSRSVADRVFDRLVDKGYIDDEKFAYFWVENRHQRKGVSIRKLKSELLARGIATTVIDKVLSDSSRNDNDELLKVIAKKQNRYDDPQKLIQYLMRQGFSYDDVRHALSNDS